MLAAQYKTAQLPPAPLPRPCAGPGSCHAVLAARTQAARRTLTSTSRSRPGAIFIGALD